MGKEKNSGKIQSIERMVNILDQFTLQEPERRFTDLVNGTGLNKSTAHNLISTMEQLGVLEQDENNREYHLGSQMIRFGETAKRSNKIIEIARPHMETLCSSMKETVQLAKLEKGQVIYMDKIYGPSPVRVSSECGAVAPAYATALGRAMLAHQNEEYIREYAAGPFEKFTSHTLSSVEELMAELKKVRSEGYAWDNGGFIEDLEGYAAPVFDQKGRVRYAVSVLSFVYAHSEARAKVLSEAVMKAADAISEELGYCGS